MLLDFVQSGDTLIVTHIDRLARSMKDLQDIVPELMGQGVALRATEQPVDTGTAAGEAFLDMLGVFTRFETNLRRERQPEGSAKAKARGVYRGRKPSVSSPKFAACASKAAWDQQPLPANLALVEPRSTAPWEVCDDSGRHRADRRARDAPRTVGRTARPISAT
jgi:DNA invertase Pin-like site-specific DNA recombinase